jgi:hypothetical protein
MKTSPRQRRIVGGVVFCAVRVVSKKSGGLVLPRTSCYFYQLHVSTLFLGRLQILYTLKHQSPDSLIEHGPLFISIVQSDIYIYGMVK